METKKNISACGISFTNHLIATSLQLALFLLIVNISADNQLTTSFV